MEELMSKLQGILGSQEGQEQLKNIQNMLGNSNNQPQDNAPPQNSGFDLSSLANMFSSMGGAQAPSNAPPAPVATDNNNNGGGFDLSSIMSMLGGMGGGNAGANTSENNTTSSGMPNIDINMIMNLQKIFSSMNISDKNSQLLLALKPHFSESRAKKVDQAIGMMKIFSIWPLLKDSGIFKGLTDIIS